jgi:uncharacterized repeat protein (TIGR03843 family)
MPPVTSAHVPTATAARCFDHSPIIVTHPALTPLLGGDLEITGRLLSASNATFLSELRCGEDTITCVYKPARGERPLWDFPHRTLGLREVAAYEVSRIGGFDLVPVTVMIEGPLGAGSLQRWVEEDEKETSTLVDLVSADTLPRQGWFTCVEGLGAGDQPVAVIHADRPELRLLAVFDALINNADRKGGHILGSGGRVFGVDHGVSFHTDLKLRTLLWGWAGAEVTDAELAHVERVRELAPGELRTLLSEAEIEALIARADVLIERRRLPRPRGSWPAIPWPPF